MFSITIPTMQVNKKVLNMLISQLVSSDTVGEVIIIDNSQKGINFKSSKVRIIKPQKNLYVNPSWNLGVKKSKYQYVGILNDDLLFPNNFFEQVLEFIKNNDTVDFIGLETIEKTPVENFQDYPQNTELKFEQLSERCSCWGSAIFFKKEKYIKIPEKMKIWCGDDFLFYTSKYVYKICNSNIKHWHALTSGINTFDSIKMHDKYLYENYYSKGLIPPELSLLQKLFSITNDNKNHYVIRLFGVKITLTVRK